MLNLLTLYNPYYQKDVIEQHINILLSQDSQPTATVAFGKIRSKLRDYATYGNTYVYPLVVDMDSEVDYFETDNDEFRYFTEI